MKKLLILVICLMSTGCATVHDYCVANADHYSSYEECYGERSARKQAIANAFRSMGGNSTQVSCSSYNIGNTVQTNCR